MSKRIKKEKDQSLSDIAIGDLVHLGPLKESYSLFWMDIFVQAGGSYGPFKVLDISMSGNEILLDIEGKEVPTRIDVVVKFYCN